MIIIIMMIIIMIVIILMIMILLLIIILVIMMMMITGPRRAHSPARHQGSVRLLGAAQGLREFAKGGLVKEGSAIRHVFNFHVKHGT